MKKRIDLTKPVKLTLTKFAKKEFELPLGEALTLAKDFVSKNVGAKNGWFINSYYTIEEKKEVKNESKDD